MPTATAAADLILMAAGVQPCAGLAETRRARRPRRPDRGRRAHAHRAPTASTPRATSRSPTTPPPAATWRSSTGARRSTWARSRAATIAGEDAQWDVAPGFWSTIGEHTLKYVAWGDGFDEARLVDHGGGAWTIWYGREGVTVGVLTHERDEDYETRPRAGRSRRRRCREMRACVVVPARDEEELIGACIAALAAQDGRRPRRRTRSCSCSTAAPTRPRRAPAPRPAT